jgi:hypothetical protein
MYFKIKEHRPQIRRCPAVCMIVPQRFDYVIHPKDRRSTMIGEHTLVSKPTLNSQEVPGLIMLKFQPQNALLH